MKENEIKFRQGVSKSILGAITHELHIYLAPLSITEKKKNEEFDTGETLSIKSEGSGSEAC